MESREEILANFQACTGIQDIGEALQLLEDSDWVLLDAVNRAIPGAAQDQGVDPTAPRPATPPINVHSLDPQPPILIPDDSPPSLPQMIAPRQDIFSSYLNAEGVAGPSSRPGVTIAGDYLPLGNSQRSRLLELNITYRERMIFLKVPDNESIQTVKDLLQAETGVPPCSQEIRGWTGNTMYPATNRRLLSELNLPKENFLYLLTPEVPVVVEDDVIEVVIEDYNLNIMDLKHDKTYNLKFGGNRLVSDVKRDIATVTTIPIFRQVWTGWPDGTRDEYSLVQSGVGKTHTLTVTQTTPGPSMPVLEAADQQIVEVDISDDDEFQDAADHMEEDEDMFSVQSTSRSGIQPLLPDDFGDEALAGIKFGEEFTNRYGQPSPHFFPGSLDDALNESCNRSTQERKMLAVYLHHDSSVLTNVFCTQVLCAEPVIGLLLENFVTWGWDLSFNSNKQRLLDMINRHFGSVAAQRFRSFEVEKLPIVILIAKLRGNLEIFRIVHGNITLDEFMTEILTSTESYNQQVGVEVTEELERNERNYMKEEQERAYQEAQLADQVREKAKEEAEAEAQLQTQLEEAKRRSEIEAKELEEKTRREEKEAAQEILPDEPAAEDSKPLANIRFRTPTETLNRRFYATDTLHTLLLYLASIGYRPAEYKILSSWPRRDISTLSEKSSLADLKLCPQETLTLEAHAAMESDSE